MLSFESKNLIDLEVVASSIANHLNWSTVCFYGEMGSGKTTLIKTILAKMNVTEPAHSPTFSIVNKYISIDNKTVYHFDFYRINKEEEAFDMGFEEYLDSKHFCFIEWPEKIVSFLPKNFHKVQIKHKENLRIITFE